MNDKTYIHPIQLQNINKTALIKINKFVLNFQ
jgi:hypothetical protein